MFWNRPSKRKVLEAIAVELHRLNLNHLALVKLVAKGVEAQQEVLAMSKECKNNAAAMADESQERAAKLMAPVLEFLNQKKEARRVPEVSEGH